LARVAHIQKRGANRWRARYRTSDGRERSQTFKRRIAAERFLHEIEAAKARDAWVDPSAGRIAFHQWAEQWFTGKVRLRAATRAKNRSLLDNHVLPAFGATRVNAVTRSDVQGWLRRLADEGYAPKTVHECSGLLASIMAEAVEEGMIAKSPCRRLELPQKEHRERRFLTEDQVVQLLSATPSLYQALIFTAAYIGLRWEELAALKRARLDVREDRPATMRLVAVIERAGGTYRYTEEMKSKKARRTIRLPETAREVLAGHLINAPESEWVFPAQEGGHLRYDNFRLRVWKPSVERAALAPLTFHELRHTAAAFMIDDGADPYLVMRRLGHEDIRTTYNL
jgi:integrase